MSAVRWNLRPFLPVLCSPQLVLRRRKSCFDPYHSSIARSQPYHKLPVIRLAGCVRIRLGPNCQASIIDSQTGNYSFGLRSLRHTRMDSVVCRKAQSGSGTTHRSSGSVFGASDAETFRGVTSAEREKISLWQSRRRRYACVSILCARQPRQSG